MKLIQILSITQAVYFFAALLLQIQAPSLLVLPGINRFMAVARMMVFWQSSRSVMLLPLFNHQLVGQQRRAQGIHYFLLLLLASVLILIHGFFPLVGQALTITIPFPQLQEPLEQLLSLFQITAAYHLSKQ